MFVIEASLIQDNNDISVQNQTQNSPHLQFHHLSVCEKFHCEPAINKPINKSYLHPRFPILYYRKQSKAKDSEKSKTQGLRGSLSVCFNNTGWC